MRKQCKNDPKTMQKTSQKRCKNDPKTTQKRSQNDEKTIPKLYACLGFLFSELYFCEGKRQDTKLK